MHVMFLYSYAYISSAPCLDSGLDLHWTINRKSNDLSEMDHPSYCDFLMQPPLTRQEMELNYCLSIDLKQSKEAALSSLVKSSVGS